jgi:hypothetical protein
MPKRCFASKLLPLVSLQSPAWYARGAVAQSRTNVQVPGLGRGTTWVPSGAWPVCPAVWGSGDIQADDDPSGCAAAVSLDIVVNPETATIESRATVDQFAPLAELPSVFRPALTEASEDATADGSQTAKS